MAEQNKTISILEDLIETCRDGQNGFQQAAEHAKAPELREFFNTESLKRASFAGELEVLVQQLGKADPDRTGSMAGALHRGWFAMKEKLGGGDESILNSVEAGEDTAKKAYEKAIKEPLPSDVLAILRRQFESVLASHDRARTLRDAFKNAA